MRFLLQFRYTILLGILLLAYVVAIVWAVERDPEEALKGAAVVAAYWLGRWSQWKRAQPKRQKRRYPR
ncbi:MAG TPA: hypothetical protein VLI04_14810 [Nocardioidaceae bacterium]|nr:hypothetical protein [Nocardioidaceae bacterium]